jgi:ABC-2 type transport system ATP-binding protein
MNILDVNNVHKQYSNHKAVDGVSFSVPKGCIFGLLGPNGAGKTSLIRIITGITQADEGSVSLDGGKVDQRNPSKIGYMPEERGLYKQMKVGEHLIYLARLKGMSKSEAKQQLEYWLEKFDIADWRKKKVQELSKGMQQKIQFISTVIHQPRLLILDEPFSGLDPINANLMQEEIFQLKSKGASIILSTHRMEQVEEICEYMVMINQGKNVLDGSLKEVKEKFKEHKFRIRHRGQLPENSTQGIDIVSKKEGEVIIQVEDDAYSNQYLNSLINSGLFIESFEEILPTVNEIFIKVAGQAKVTA